MAHLSLQIGAALVVPLEPPRRFPRQAGRYMLSQEEIVAAARWRNRRVHAMRNVLAAQAGSGDDSACEPATP